MNLSACIEAILFSAGHSLSFKEIAGILRSDEDSVYQTVMILQSDYVKNERGIRLVAAQKSVELVIADEYQKQAQKFISEEKSAITRAQIDTLSVLAYRGPISQEELEHIRGVNSSIILNHLLIQGLIEKIDNPTGAQYAITPLFLKGLGVESVSELPDYEILSQQTLFEKTAQNG